MSEPLHANTDRPTAQPSSDHTLVRYVRGGDEAAAEELYRRYAARLRRLVADRYTSEFLSRFDPDDIVQSVFRVLYEGVRSKFYDVPQGGELWGLLFVMAINKVRDQIAYHRAARRNVRRTNGADVESGDLFGKDESTAALLRLTVEEYLAGLDVSGKTAKLVTSLLALKAVPRDAHGLAVACQVLSHRLERAERWARSK